MPMDSVFTGSIIVNRPIMEVFDYARDPNKIYEWHPFHSKLEIVDRGENILSFNVTYNRIISPLMPTFRVDLTEMVLGRRLVYRCRKGGIVFTIEFEPSSRGTVIYSSMSLWSWQAALLEFTVPLSRPFFNDRIAQSLSNFKRNAEAKEPKNDPFVFFSYRRALARYTGGRIYDGLLQEFGEGFVFRDINSISAGSAWETNIEDALRNCKVVIAHIDDSWETEISKIIDSNDVLREELNIALQEQKVFIPVFTSQQTNFSTKDRLDKIDRVLGNDRSNNSVQRNNNVNERSSKIKNILEALHKRQGLLLRTDPDFQQDFQKLAQTVWAIVRKPADRLSEERDRSSVKTVKIRPSEPRNPAPRATRPPRPRSRGGASSARLRRNP